MAVNPLLQDVYRSESEEIRERFEDSHDGQATVRERSDLIDQVLTQLWNRNIAVEARSERLCVMALGGYGRRALFPYSDIDVLFLCESEPVNIRGGKSSAASAKRSGTCTCALAPPPVLWLNAGSFSAITLSSMSRFWTAVTFAGMPSYLSNCGPTSSREWWPGKLRN